MRILRLLALTLLLLAKAAQTYSQDTIGLNTIIEKTIKSNKDYPREKVYLHFDKPYYAVGDTIWFKAYVALSQNQPSDLSQVLYVDLMSESDTLIKSLKLPVVNTSAYGTITLDPLLFKTGNYRIRAYTYWMLNWNEESFFFKNIRIGDAFNPKIITNISLKGEDAGQTQQIKARILYKDPDGKPLANKKLSWKVVSNFETLSKGKETTDAVGALSLTLTAGQKKALEAGVLETVVENNDAQQITSKFSLSNAFAEADIQFFPEGGELVDQVSGKVAFKAIQEKGLGIEVKGEITDNSGKVIATIESQHLGMGSFSFMPEAGKSYKANLKFANGIKKSFPLPAAKPAAITLAANVTNSENLLLQISSSPSFFSANKNKPYYILAQSMGVICYAAQTKLNSATLSASIPKSKFPTGILQISLLSASGEPLTERLVFIKHSDVLKLSVSTDKKQIAVRQPVKMNIVAKNSGTPVEGNFSVSVINENKVPIDDDEEITILSSFLLTSELSGFVEKPNYYFNQGKDENKFAHLDLLMLTQGYRRFSYRDILADKHPPISFLPEQGITYTGTLRSSNGMPVSKGSLRLEVMQNRFSAEATTDLKGRFEFKNVVVPDSSEIAITARNSNGSRNMMIMLDGSAFPAISKNINAPEEVLNIDSILSPYLENSRRQYKMSAQMLQEVVIQSTVLAKPSHKDHSALSTLGMPDHLFSSERFKNCTMLLGCLQNSLPGLTFIDNTFFVTRVLNSGLRVPVQIFYNGMPVDANYLNSILPADVESAEVFLRDELGTINRMYGTNGILVINAKKDAKKPVTAAELKALLPPNNVLTFTSFGYPKTREFYAPKYNTTAGRSVGIDLRPTVYWNPKVFTDKNGTMSFDFFNGDLRGTYKATVEGTDIDGNLARFVYRYKVE